jgi:hypothetical protein
MVLTTALAANPALAQSGPPSDHYLSYRVEPRTAGVPIIVGDQFFPDLPAQALVFERLLNPVSQDGAAFFDSTAHLDWWRVTPPAFVGRQVFVINKFGAGVWSILNVEFLLAPSRKNEPNLPPPDNINHFLCYRADGPMPLNENVHLRDQFQQFTTVVGQPRFFCNPCFKRHGPDEYPIVDPIVHLAVYEILSPSFTAPILTRDQFGQFQTLVISSPPEFLFVPSFKEETVPAEPSTWGQIKSIFR